MAANLVKSLLESGECVYHASLTLSSRADVVFSEGMFGDLHEADGTITRTEPLRQADVNSNLSFAASQAPLRYIAGFYATSILLELLLSWPHIQFMGIERWLLLRQP